MPFLELHVPGGTQQRVDLKAEISLGRSSGCDVPLAYKGVSRQHAFVREGDDGWRLVDNGSRNGTFVNGQRVEGSVDLGEGDSIQIGPVQLVLRSRDELRQLPPEEATLHTIPQVRLERFRPSDEIEDPEQIARDYDKLRAAHTLSQRIGLERDPDRIASSILQFCLDTLPVDNGAVLSRQGDTWVPAAHRTTDGRPYQVSTTVLSRMEQTRRSLWVVDASRDARVQEAQSVLDMGLKSVLAVPMMEGDVVVGAIVLDNITRRSAFRVNDLHVLGGIAAAASLALQRVDLLEAMATEARKRERLERLVAPEVAEQVIRGEIQLEKGGRVTELSMLFCDLRGFTRMSRVVGPIRTMERLNAWFQVAVEEVRRHGGVVDKFVGDELIAVWGIPLAREDDADRSLACAIGLRRRLAELPHLEGEDPLSCGIGVHRGQATVGLLGSDQQMQFTAIGDTVNVCSRLCGLAQAGEILVHARAMEACVEPFPFESRAPVRVRGLDEPVPMVALADEDPTVGA